MNRARTWVILWSALAIVGLVRGAEAAETRQEELLEKRRAKAEKLEPYVITSGEHRLLGIEQTRLPQKIFVRGWRGFRPVFGGAPQGAGFFVGGVGYTAGLESDVIRLDANARTSTNRFHIFDALLQFPTALSGSPLRFTVDGSWQDLTRVAFYGIGNDSENFRTFYRRKEYWGGASASYTPSRWLELSVDGRFLSPRTLSSDREPKIQDNFSPEEVPGFEARRTEYVVYGGNVAVFLRDTQFPSAGLTLRASTRRFDEQSGDYSFVRVTGSAIAHIPLGYRNRVLALRFRTSHSNADSGQTVPFYLMEGVGGARTVRGFAADRFIDQRNLQINLEYRWEVWTYLDFTLYYDLAKVFPNSDGTDLTNMKQGYGIGVRIVPPGTGSIRLELAHSEEGFQFYWAGGDVRFW